MTETEPAGRQPFFIGGTDGAIILNVGCVGIGCERRDERVEDVGGKGDERRQARVRVGKGDLEAQDGRCIRAWWTVSKADEWESLRLMKGTHRHGRK